jgi:hypothetical protein
LARPLFSALREAGLDEEAARRTAELSLLLAAAHAIGISSAGPASPVKRPSPDLAAAALRLLSDPRARAFLRVNVHAGTTWFDKERFEELARGLEVCAAGFVGDTATTPGPEAKARKAARATAAATASRPGPDRQVSAQTLVEMAAGAGYRLDGLAASLEALAGRRV